MDCHGKSYLLLALMLIVPASGLRLAKTLDSKECSHNYAVCVVGAVRSMVGTKQDRVITSFTRNMVDPMHGCGNFFFHLFVAQELSDKGQFSINKSNAGSMAKALQHATAFSFQYDENKFTCGQQATGRFPKIEACARMVRKYEAKNDVVHDMFILTRPDVHYTAPFPMKMFDDMQPEHQDWFMQYVSGDLYVTSGGAALSLLEQTHTARCCDGEKREPNECFVAHLTQPKSNFIFRRYLTDHLTRLDPLGSFSLKIVRTDEMFQGGTTGNYQEHGLYRPDVLQVEHPKTMESWDWKDMDDNLRIALMERMLNF